MGGQSGSSVLDLTAIGTIAGALNTDESFIEKDWHVVRASGVIAAIPDANVTPVFSGGTSLSKGWNLIRRFSEDIDFKVVVTAASKSAARKTISAYRPKFLSAMVAAGFMPIGEPLVGNAGQFLRADFDYGAKLPLADGLRRGLQVEMTFDAPARTPSLRPVRSFVAQAKGEPPEVSGILCVDPVETASDKLSALAWRTHARDRASPKDDPTIVRHLHDLAALAAQIANSSDFVAAARTVLEDDAKRAKDTTMTGESLLRAMLPTISGDPLWRDEYERFVGRFSYAVDDELITFDRAVEACEILVARVLGAGEFS
jgi:hypothetical protein